jgi:MoaA/NifB/PqqE/SkfB family radical SAM enzyme
MNKPTYCCIALLESCFLKCRMCYKGRNGLMPRNPDEPTLEQWKGFISSLNGLVDPGFQINFAGGEPLSRPETLELVKHAANNGFRTLLATNAFLLNEDVAKRIGNSGLTIVNISLDSLKEERHDYIRGIKGVYRNVIRAFELLDKYAPLVSVGVCSVIMRENLEEAPAIARWIQDNPKIDGMGFQAVTQPFSTPEDPMWYRDEQFAHLWPKDVAQVDAVMDELIAMKETGKYNKLGNPATQFRVYKAYFRNPNNFVKKYRCHLDTRAVNVTPEGEMRICFYMDAIGNIKNDDINRAWPAPESEAVRQKIAGCSRNCQSMVNCNFDDSEIYLS